MEEVKDVLVKAREIVAEKWCQGSWYKNTTGEVCALGAVGLALDPTAPERNNFISIFTRRDLHDAIDNSATGLYAVTMLANAAPITVELSHARYVVMNYNDRDDRTKGEVLAWFDRAIKMVS